MIIKFTPHVLSVTSRNLHDSKIMENIIDNNYFNNKSINLVDSRNGYFIK